MTRLRIRRCNGNRAAWLMCRVNRDGSEAGGFGSYATAMSVDALLRDAGHLAPLPGQVIELIPFPDDGAADRSAAEIAAIVAEFMSGAVEVPS